MKLSVAMCTYNGTAYLQQQLASISKQKRLPEELIVCDDGSNDGTLAILHQFAKTSPFPVFTHVNPENLGVVPNFWKAISLCGGDLIALADQDDIWLPDKLERAEHLIRRGSNPATTLYCSRLQYVHANGDAIGLSKLPSSVVFSNAIVENIATGCSVVFGAEIRRRFLEASPDDMLMHDWWAYLLAAAFGEVIYDAIPSVQYRQHGRNVAGWQPKPLKLWNRSRSLLCRLQNHKQGMDSLNQAARFIAAYPEITDEKRRIVKELISLRDKSPLERLHYALQPRVARNDSIENLGLKIMLLMGWH